jgi:hypothetical protein
VEGSSWTKLFSRKDVGVGNGEGRSGSILRFALRDVKNAVVCALARIRTQMSRASDSLHG